MTQSAFQKIQKDNSLPGFFALRTNYNKQGVYPVRCIGQENPFRFSTPKEIHISTIRWVNPFDPYMPAGGFEMGVMSHSIK